MLKELFHGGLLLHKNFFSVKNRVWTIKLRRLTASYYPIRMDFGARYVPHGYVLLNHLGNIVMRIGSTTAAVLFYHLS